jgi:hypothetical protein
MKKQVSALSKATNLIILRYLRQRATPLQRQQVASSSSTASARYRAEIGSAAETAKRRLIAKLSLRRAEQRVIAGLVVL